MRRRWLAQFLARKSPPKGALRFMLAELAAGHWTLCQLLGQGSRIAAELLGVDGRDGISAALATAGDQRQRVRGQLTTNQATRVRAPAVSTAASAPAPRASNWRLVLRAGVPALA